MAAEAAAAPGAIYQRPPAYLLLEQDHKDINALADAGIPRTTAMVLITLHRYSKGVEVTSRWLERVTDLRQPEVSIAMGHLKDAGLITTTESKAHSKGGGRPIAVYHVRGDIAKYLRDRIAVRMGELNRGIMTINKIFEGE